MNIYLASRYSRRLELVGYRQLLIEAGHVVTSRWLDGDHQISADGRPIGDQGESLIEGDDGSTTERAAQMRCRFAVEDVCDVMKSELLIAFTEPPRSGHSRGGRHVELGIAVGAGKAIWVVGHRENLFCWLPTIEFFERFGEALALLDRVTAGGQRRLGYIQPST